VLYNFKGITAQNPIGITIWITKSNQTRINIQIKENVLILLIKSWNLDH